MWGNNALHLLGIYTWDRPWHYAPQHASLLCFGRFMTWWRLMGRLPASLLKDLLTLAPAV